MGESAKLIKNSEKNLVGLSREKSLLCFPPCFGVSGNAEDGPSSDTEPDCEGGDILKIGCDRPIVAGACVRPSTIHAG